MPKQYTLYKCGLRGKQAIVTSPDLKAVCNLGGRSAMTLTDGEAYAVYDEAGKVVKTWFCADGSEIPTFHRRQVHQGRAARC